MVKGWSKESHTCGLEEVWGLLVSAKVVEEVVERWGSWKWPAERLSVSSLPSDAWGAWGGASWISEASWLSGRSPGWKPSRSWGWRERRMRPGPAASPSQEAWWTRCCWSILFHCRPVHRPVRLPDASSPPRPGCAGRDGSRVWNCWFSFEATHFGYQGGVESINPIPVWHARSPQTKTN